MAGQSPIARYVANLREERNAVFLYEQMAKAEPNPSLARLYEKLAETERRHVATWEARLRAEGIEPPAPGADWRTRTLSWLGRRLGASFILPTVSEIETGAGNRYANQPETRGTAMAAEERSHARMFRMLSSDGGQGLQGSAVARMEGRHRSTGGNALRAGVLGANNGLVSVLSLVMGVAGARMNSHSILVAGGSGLLAGAISMALGEWLSVQSSRELHSHQIDIEREELASNPQEEMEELTLIYQAKGMAPERAGELARHLLSDPAQALDALTREELGLDPGELGGSAWEAAGTSFLLFAAGAILPLVPFFFATGAAAVAWSAVLSGVGLFAIGAGITLVTGRSLWRSGARQILFGLGAAGITYTIGRLVGVQLGL